MVRSGLLSFQVEDIDHEAINEKPLRRKRRSPGSSAIWPRARANRSRRPHPEGWTRRLSSVRDGLRRSFGRFPDDHAPWNRRFWESWSGPIT